MQITDLHNDALLELPPPELEKYLAALPNGITINLSIWTTELPDPMKVIRERRPPEPHRLHIEDAWFLTPENIDEFIALRPFSVGLTWNKKNRLAGGALSRGGITKWGYEVIKKLEDRGIQIDTAHLSRRSFWQFARVTTRPILCTHTAFNAVTGHPRNLTAQQVKKVIATNGLVGLTFVREFLSRKPEKCGVADAVSHILYYRKFDPAFKHLGIGTDFYGTKPVPGLTDYAAFENLAKALCGYNIPDETIQKILHKNGYEFLRTGGRT